MTVDEARRLHQNGQLDAWATAAIADWWHNADDRMKRLDAARWAAARAEREARWGLPEHVAGADERGIA